MRERNEKILCEREGVRVGRGREMSRGKLEKKKEIDDS